MRRVNVIDENDELVGWFDAEAAESFGEAEDWDGNNMISRATGDQFYHETLYRTAGGRWA